MSRTLADAVDEDVAGLLSFPVGDAAVKEIASRLIRWLEMPHERRAAARQALSDAARGRYGWERVAEGVIAAAEGRLDALPAADAPDRLPAP